MLDVSRSIESVPERRSRKLEDSLRLVFALVVPFFVMGLLGCGSSASAGGPSSVHSWIVHDLDSWVAAQATGTDWNTSAGGGGGATNSLLGGGFQYTYDYHLSAALPKPERSPLIVSLRNELIGQISAIGGRVNGHGETGDPLIAFDLTYDVGATRGSLAVHTVDGENDTFHIIVVAHEVR